MTINNTYYYLAQAVGPNGDKLTFSLAMAVPSAEINSRTGAPNLHFSSPQAAAFRRGWEGVISRCRWAGEGRSRREGERDREIP